MSLSWGQLSCWEPGALEPSSQSSKLIVHIPLRSSSQISGARCASGCPWESLARRQKIPRNPIYELLRRKSMKLWPWHHSNTWTWGSRPSEKKLCRSLRSVRRNEIGHKELRSWQWKTPGDTHRPLLCPCGIKAKCTHHVLQAVGLTKMSLCGKWHSHTIVVLMSILSVNERRAPQSGKATAYMIMSPSIAGFSF